MGAKDVDGAAIQGQSVRACSCLGRRLLNDLPDLRRLDSDDGFLAEGLGFLASIPEGEGLGYMSLEGKVLVVAFLRAFVMLLWGTQAPLVAAAYPRRPQKTGQPSWARRRDGC